MTNLLWMAVVIALLGGHGLMRGYSPTLCKAVVLCALGVVIACLVTIGGWWAWALNALAALLCALLAFHDPGHAHRASASPSGRPRQATLRTPQQARRNKQAAPKSRRRGT